MKLDREFDVALLTNYRFWVIVFLWVKANLNFKTTIILIILILYLVLRFKLSVIESIIIETKAKVL